jgi:hypothetical protein
MIGGGVHDGGGGGGGGWTEVYLRGLTPTFCRVDMPAFSDEIQKKCGDIHELKEVAFDSPPALPLGTTPNPCLSGAFFAALVKVDAPRF